MSSIDLVILGILMEGPQSAYDIQKDVEYHHFPRWTRISVPSIYKKVLQLKEKGYLDSTLVKGERFADKAVYSITPAGRAHFSQLMNHYASQPVPLQFDFNVVITNLNKLPPEEARPLIRRLQGSLQNGLRTTAQYAAEYAEIPLVGRSIFDQQARLYEALLQWLEDFEAQFTEEG
ncbi:PadR family transcriptional regulator [Evtepia sp.]|uniref:PadR family transcriptional regulator n=1 Tax=Evtepia sp. TaxID=2773933 RepID=UPI003F184268